MSTLGDGEQAVKMVKLGRGGWGGVGRPGRPHSELFSMKSFFQDTEKITHSL